MNKHPRWRVVDQDAAQGLNEAMNDAVTALGALAASPTLNARVKQRIQRALNKLLDAHDLLSAAIEWR